MKVRKIQIKKLKQNKKKMKKHIKTFKNNTKMEVLKSIQMNMIEM